MCTPIYSNKLEFRFSRKDPLRAYLAPASAAPRQKGFLCTFPRIGLTKLVISSRSRLKPNNGAARWASRGGKSGEITVTLRERVHGTAHRSRRRHPARPTVRSVRCGSPARLGSVHSSRPGRNVLLHGCGTLQQYARRYGRNGSAFCPEPRVHGYVHGHL